MIIVSFVRNKKKERERRYENNDRRKIRFLKVFNAFKASLTEKIRSPYFRNILLETEGENQVKLVATNLEVGMSTILPASEHNGKYSIPAQKYSEILRELPEASLALSGMKIIGLR